MTADAGSPGVDDDAASADATTVDTVLGAVQWLAEHGYGVDLNLYTDGLGHAGAAERYPFAASAVDHTFRFEGDSNPDDEAIVLGITCPGGVRGTLVSAYGPGADADEIALLRSLARPPSP